MAEGEVSTALGTREFFSFRLRLKLSWSFGRYSPARPQISSTWSFEPYDENNPGPYATFVFRYRSKGMLGPHTMIVHPKKCPEFLVDQGIMNAADLDAENATQEDTPPATPQTVREPFLTPSPSPSPQGGPSLVRCPPSTVYVRVSSILSELILWKLSMGTLAG